VPSQRDRQAGRFKVDSLWTLCVYQGGSLARSPGSGMEMAAGSMSASSLCMGGGII